MAKKPATAILSPPLPPVAIEYDSRNGRVTKHFEDAYEARQFYTAKDKAGKNPKVKKGQLASDAPAQAKRSRKAAAAAPVAAPPPPAAVAAPNATQPDERQVEAAPAPAKPKTPGVAWMETRSFVAGQIIKRHGLEAGVTDEMVEELDRLFANGTRPKPVQSKFDLQAAWQCIRGFTGFTRQ